MIFFSPSGTHMETLCYARVQSPVGSLILGVSEKGLRALEFDRGQFPPKTGKSTVWSQSARALADYAYQLAEYFAGTRREFTFRLDLHGTDFPTKSIVRKASLFYFVFVMYSYTTAGPFGLEDQVTTSGPGMTLIYHLILPFFWCIPISLVAAELTTAMPVQGGFYRWVRAAFGDFWGFLAGWWNWSASFLLGGAYAVLFTDYLGFYFPQIIGWKHYVVSIVLIEYITWLNDHC